MDALWYVPAVVLLVALIPLGLAVARTTAEARHLTRELVRFGEVRAALVRVRDEATTFRTSVEGLRRR